MFYTPEVQQTTAACYSRATALALCMIKCKIKPLVCACAGVELMPTEKKFPFIFKSRFCKTSALAVVSNFRSSYCHHFLFPYKYKIEGRKGIISTL
jgi:hypothetical protein